MQALLLSSHTGRPVTVDHCGPCRQIWFEQFESVALDARGWIRLLRRLEDGAALPAAGPATERPACPACRAPLKAVANQSRFGRFSALECPSRHGHLHGQAGLLAERGLVRPLMGPERKALQQEARPIVCLNCGAPSDGRGERCAYCASPLMVLDLPRLAHSLKPRLADLGPAPAVAGAPLAWPCRGCGAALDPTRDTACGRCGHVVAVVDLPAIEPLLVAAEAALDRAAAAVAERRRSPYGGAAQPSRLAETAIGPASLDRHPHEVFEASEDRWERLSAGVGLVRLLLNWLRAVFPR